jgi:hypothetical protein
VTQTGIYVGAALGPAGFGALASGAGYGTAWAAVAVTTVMSAVVLWLASRVSAVTATPA